MSQRKRAALAKLYDDNSEFQFGQGKKLISGRHMSVEAGQRILDLGCGTGRLASHVATMVGPTGCVVGVDPNSERLRLARVRNASQLNVEVVLGKVHDVTSHGPFDGVVCNFLLEWLPDAELRSTLAAVYDVMKPGAQLCANVTIFTGKMGDDLCHLLRGGSEATVANFNSHQTKYWRNLFESFGFEVVVCAKKYAYGKYESARDYFQAVKANTEDKVNWEELSSSDVEKLLSDHGLASLDSPLEIVEENGQLVMRKPW